MTRLTPRQLLPLTALVLLSGLAAAPAAADSPGSHPNFAQEFHAARIVSIVTVTAAASDGSATLTTQEVLKGDAAAVRRYPADDKAVDLTVGTKVVLLQGGETLDFRGTWALPVASDGTLDAQGLSGAPATLAELEAFAALPDTSTVLDAPTTQAPPAGILLLAGFGLLAIAALWFRAASRRRTR